MDNQKQNVQLTVPASLGFSQVVRNIANEIFSITKFTRAWQARLKLVVDELFMNAVLYGSKEGASKIYLTFYFDEKKVEFSIEDEGNGSQTLTVDDLRKLILKNENNESITKTSGRGLAMIANLWTDSIAIDESEHGGIKITCIKNVDTSEPPIPPVSPEIAEAKASAQADAKDGLAKVVSVVLSGEIDQSNIEEKSVQVESRLKSATANTVIELDFSGVTYINSTFIGHLAHWHNEIQKKQGTLRIKNPIKDVKDVLDIVGLSRVIEII